jgi:Transcriptional regulator, AbiEi antitoxin
VHAELGNADEVIARIAARQHGVITLAQLESTGIHRQGRATRLKRGQLHRIHRSVFSVGHTGLSREGRWMAAVLAVGPEAFLSHTSAGALWGIIGSRKRASSRGVELAVHVMVHNRSESRRGIRVHRSRTLGPGETTIQLGIPVTTPSRTLRDLRRALPQPQFAAAMREAEFLRLSIAPELYPDHTRSELESQFLSLCRRHRLSKPVVNAAVGPSPSIFSGQSGGWSSRSTGTALMAAAQPSRRIARATSSWSCSVTGWSASRGVKSRSVPGRSARRCGD